MIQQNGVLHKNSSVCTALLFKLEHLTNKQTDRVLKHTPASADCWQFVKEESSAGLLLATYDLLQGATAKLCYQAPIDCRKLEKINRKKKIFLDIHWFY